MTHELKPQASTSYSHNYGTGLLVNLAHKETRVSSRRWGQTVPKQLITQMNFVAIQHWVSILISRHHTCKTLDKSSLITFFILNINCFVCSSLFRTRRVASH